MARGWAPSHGSGQPAEGQSRAASGTRRDWLTGGWTQGFSPLAGDWDFRPSASRAVFRWQPREQTLDEKATRVLRVWGRGGRCHVGARHLPRVWWTQCRSVPSSEEGGPPPGALGRGEHHTAQHAGCGGGVLTSLPSHLGLQPGLRGAHAHPFSLRAGTTPSQVEGNFKNSH